MDKQHVSIVIAGHVDSGKSSYTGQLLYQLNTMTQREKDKLQAEADALGKGSFVFAFYTDNNKAERERGITINSNCKDFYTEKYHYTIIDAPGHRDFVKNMLSGSSAADVGCLMVPADSFTTAMAKKNKDEGTVEGQTRQHALLLNLLGLKQLIVQINKMDLVNYSEEKYNEIKDEVQNMLISVGWPKPFVMNNVPIIPISAMQGDNLLNPSEKMPWFTGMKVKNISGEIVNICTSMDALNTFVQPPQRFPDKQFRLCVSNIYNIKGTGTVVAGRIEQGTLKPGDQIKFLPRHTDALPCRGRVFAIEQHHKELPSAGPGDNVGLNIKGLTKENMPKAGDIMVLESDNSIFAPKRIIAQAKILDCPNELKVGYTPTLTVRTAKVPARISEIRWRMNKDTGNTKSENPGFFKSGDMVEVVLVPQVPIVVDEFKNCDGLGRLCCLEGNSVVMIGKAVGIEANGPDDKTESAKTTGKPSGKAGGKSAPKASANC